MSASNSGKLVAVVGVTAIAAATAWWWMRRRRELSAAASPASVAELPGVEAEAQAAADEPPRRLSKREKRAARQQHRAQMHEMYGAQRRKERRMAAYARRRQFLESMSRDERAAYVNAERDRETAQLKKIEHCLETGQKVAFDLAYCDHLNAFEMHSLSRQLLEVWAANKKHEHPFALYFCNFQGPAAESLLKRDAGNWTAVRTEKSVFEMFPPEQIVYLSPDSPHELEALDPTAVYVVGGLIDRTRKNNMSVTRAEKMGVRTAHLPVKKYVENPYAWVLNVNAVVEILMTFQTTGSWETAIKKHVPARFQNMDSHGVKKRRAPRTNGAGTLVEVQDGSGEGTTVLQADGADSDTESDVGGSDDFGSDDDDEAAEQKTMN